MKVAQVSPKWGGRTNRIVKENKLVTVCEEAGCPIIGECWEKEAQPPSWIIGDTCKPRACALCNVKTGGPEKLWIPPSRENPGRQGLWKSSAAGTS